MYSERLMSSECIDEARIEVRSMSADIYRLMVTPDKSENEILLKDIDSRASKFNNYIGSYKKDVDPSVEAFMKNMIELGDHNKEVAQEINNVSQNTNLVL